MSDLPNLPKCTCVKRAGDEHQHGCPRAAAIKAEPINVVIQVDHPSYYGGESNPYEAIKVIENWLTPEQFYGFLVGTSLKYYARAGKKAGESAAKDLAKAEWYTARAAKHRSRLDGK